MEMLARDCVLVAGRIVFAEQNCGFFAERISIKFDSRKHKQSGIKERVELRVRWLLKAVLPLAIVLASGIGMFVWATFAMDSFARRSILLVASGGAVIIGSVMLVALLALLHHPLLELQDKIAEVGAGNLDAEVSFAGRNDEIGDLGRNFNSMARQLRDRRDHLQQIHQTEMSRAEHLATLGELAAGLAHELRNPLAGIAGVIDVLGQDIQNGDPAKEIWKDVRNEIHNIQRILNDLLEYTRPQAPHKLVSDVNATIEQAIHRAEQQALSRPIRFVLVKGAPLAVEHDSALIGQVLLNLLLNAIQSIQTEGLIEVRVDSDEKAAHISVIDNGQGISPTHVAQVFRPFFSTKKHGTGLGLSLAQRIAEGHGGLIEVTSTPGKGSQFTLHLPLSSVSRAISPVR
jgi:signal transduction histidine kinase